MKKSREVIFLFLIVFLFLIALVSANSVLDTGIKKVTHYAEEYETGNVDYVHLLIQINAVKQSLNKELGAMQVEGGILKQDQVREILGKPTETTKWVWIEKENQEKKMDSEIPVWRKIVFDGKKIQIKLNAWPSIFGGKEYDDSVEESEITQELKGKLIYKLNFEVQFKKPEDQINVNKKIEKITDLAKLFNSDPSKENAKELAKESVNAERAFEAYFQQNQGKCEDLMISIFGAENLRETTGTIAYDIEFYSSDDFEAMLKLEMCDDCQWHWINMNMWIESRGKFKIHQENKDSWDKSSQDKYRNMESGQFMQKTEELLEKMKTSLDNKDYSEAMSTSNELNVLTQVWNEQSNNVWEQIEKQFRAEEESMSDTERQKMNENYGWIKRNQKMQQEVKEMSQANYEQRKEFYLRLFKNYEKKEYYYEQKEYEKRLIQEFESFGEEICDNNKDDNDNGDMDCSDSQCGGKVCGKLVDSEGIDNSMSETLLYCIAGTCQEKEEENTTKESVCGNHICEEDEADSEGLSGNCQADCDFAKCQEHKAIECEGGKVIFGGKDENGCPLEPVCVELERGCEVDEDCPNPLCGKAVCSEKKVCVVKELKECGEAECSEGAKKLKQCNGKELVSALCIEGGWVETGIECEIGEDEEIEEVEEIVSNECSVKSDCGGSDDVCSNGKCVTIPQTVEIEENSEKIEIEVEEPDIKFEEEKKETLGEEFSPQEEQKEETSESSSEMTGGVIFSFFRLIGSKLTGNVITGHVVEEVEDETSSNAESESEGDEPPTNDGSPEQNPDGVYNEDTPNNSDDEEEQNDEDRDQEEDREEEERERQEKEQRERCKNDCSRPCVDECIRKVCGKDMECDIDNEAKKCEGECNADDDCVNKCMKGGDWWKEFENKEQHQKEKGVFSVGGGCRTSQGQTSGFIWFGGWGEPFEDIQPIKNQFYSGGQSDWCKWELENAIKQRKEIEKGFNQEFARWFFEDYISNSAEEWEQANSGIFELYWSIVDNSRQIAERMTCLELDEIPFEYKPLNFTYETEYGSIEYWEEIHMGKISEEQGEGKPMITPYMKVWIFPSEEFIKYELKKAMETGEFPGSPEDKMERENEGGPTEKEREMIKQDEKFMKFIREISEKYGGNFDGAVQFKDYGTGEIAFNLYVRINEEEILVMKPMLPEKLPEVDATVEIDFKLLYDLVYSSEKEMQGVRIESPDWVQREIKMGDKFKEVKEGVKMFFKVRKIVNSAVVTPKSAEKDVKKVFKEFFSMMMKQGDKMDEGDPEIKKGDDDEGVGGMDAEGNPWQDKDVLTGKVISKF